MPLKDQGHIFAPGKSSNKLSRVVIIEHEVEHEVIFDRRGQ